jgi:hypothetical protein
MHKAAYRLENYRIIETENGMLWWEAHFPTAMQRRGKCFILGDILIIGHPSHEENGYLILEFHEQLEKLPVWNKTSYYCYSSNLLDIATNENLSEDLLQRRMFLSGINKADQKSIIGFEAGKFRLGQYQIIVTDNDEVEWRAHEGTKKIISGRCIIKSDVLFIGTKENDIGEQSKEEFIKELNRLLQWDNTFAWCKSMVLQACQPQQQTKWFRTASLNINPSNRSFNKQSSVFFQNRNPGTVKRLFRSGFISFKALWLRLQPGKFRLKHLIPQREGFRTASFNINHLKRSLNKRPSESFQNRYTGIVKRFLQSGLTWLKALWLHIRPGKFRLKHLIPLVVAVFLFGLVILLNLAEKKLHRSHLAKDHHHEHDYEKD